MTTMTTMTDPNTQAPALTLAEALDLAQLQADEGEQGIRDLEGNIEAMRAMMGANADRKLAEAKRGIAAMRVIIAWVRERMQRPAGGDDPMEYYGSMPGANTR